MDYQPEDPEFVRDCVRRRPSMYIGGTDTRGMTHLIWEVVANSVDQFLAGHASEVRVMVDGNRIEVSDNGDGMPFDRMDASGGNLASAYLQKIHVTPSADNHLPHVHCTGLHGAGVVVVNMLSRDFTCSAWRNGELWRQEFRQGLPVDSSQIVSRGAGRGTAVCFCPDEDIFGRQQFNEATIRRKLFEIAHLHPGLRVIFNGDTYCSEHGLADYIKAIESETERLPDGLSETFSVTDRFDNFTLNVAAAGVSSETEFRPWVNGVYTIEGGSHVNGLRNALRDVGWLPAIAAIHVVMHDPQLAGPTRGQLRAPRVARVIRKRLGPLLEDFCQQQDLGNYAKR